ncbi:hypothetical protein HA466_0148040 [Hirschfeldia incana]|nr:hypothetical protein HA466_0148040 [Hirschfeldia incana]
MAEDDEAHRFLHHPQPPPSSSMRRRATSVAAANGGCGEIVEVQGGHIVRSTGRKDRHSKVCTAKGPRDRRVRLSAHTAIQFYDVQDRLGFDRPSKAVAWLIEKAMASIDELPQLPPSNPSVSPSPPPQQQQPQQLQFGRFGGVAAENESSFLQPSFFPVVGSSTEAPQHQQLISRTNSQNQDLLLSLQPFPDGPPSLLHHHHHHSAAEPVLFYGQSNPLGYDASSTGGWEQQSIKRPVAWNSGGANDTGNNGGGFVFAPPPNHPASTTSFQPVLGQSQLYSSQRDPLQSSYSPMIPAWFDPTHHHHQSISTDDLNHHMPPPIASGEFSSGFRIPARFQGQEEEPQDGLNNKPSSASRH